MPKSYEFKFVKNLIYLTCRDSNGIETDYTDLAVVTIPEAEEILKSLNTALTQKKMYDKAEKQESIKNLEKEIKQREQDLKALKNRLHNSTIEYVRSTE